MPNIVPSVSIVIPTNGDLIALKKTLASLANQKVNPVEVKIVVDKKVASSAEISAVFNQVERPSFSFLEAEGVANARNLGASETSGEFVIFLDAGDRIPPAALEAWPKRMVRNCADVGFSRFKLASSKEVHSGLHDRKKLGRYVFGREGFSPRGDDWAYIHAHPSAKIFSRRLIKTHKIKFLESPLSSWVFFAKALSYAERAIYLENLFPVIGNAKRFRSIWRTPVHPKDLLSGVDTALANSGSDPENHQLFCRLLSRAVWEKANFADFDSEADRKSFLGDVANLLETRQVKEVDFDPFVGARIKMLFEQ